MTKRMIETAFPIIEISQLAIPERSSYKPIYQMSKWFARRSSSIFRAILLSCILNPSDDIIDEFYNATDSFKDITILDCEDYKTKRADDVKKTTVNIDIRSLKAIFQKATEWNLLTLNPFKNIKQYKISEPDKPQYLTEEQVTKLINTINNENGSCSSRYQ